MQLVIRNFFYLLLFLLMLSIERSIGLPLFSLTAATLYIASLPPLYTLISWTVVSFFLAVTFGLPFTISFMMVLSILFVIEQDIHFFFRSSFSVWLVIVLMNILIGVLTHFQLNPWLGVYHVIALSVLLLFIRYVYYRKAAVRNLTFSRQVLK